MVITEIQYSQEFYRGLIKSTALHALVLILFISLRLISPAKTEDKKNSVTIIKSSVRVDVVGMPKHTLQELKRMTMENVNAADSSPTKANDSGGSDDVTFDKKSKKVDLSNLLGSFSKRKVNVKKTKRKKNKLNLNYKKLKNLVLEGNKVSEGNALVDTGEGVEVSGQFYNYVNDLPNHIRPFWKLPSYLLEKNLNCSIRVYISKSGNLLKAEIHESSGENEYDSKALSAVKAASPFPAPSSEFSSKLARGEVILGFPL